MITTKINHDVKLCILAENRDTSLLLFMVIDDHENVHIIFDDEIFSVCTKPTDSNIFKQLVILFVVDFMLLF